MGTSFYSWLLLKVIPYIRFTTYYTSFRGWKYYRGYRLIQAGDILVCKDRKKLTAVLIPGEFTHAIQVIAAEGTAEWTVSEMTHHDYTRSNFFDICKESDRVVILRCRDYDADYIKNVVVPTCLSFEDAKYNVEFEFGIPALYCSELCYQSDKERRLQVSLEDLADLGRPYISPTGLYQAKNVDVIWDSDQEIPNPDLHEFNG